MIPRYSRAAMSTVWSDDHMFAIWLEVEIAAAQAWHELGVVSVDEIRDIRKATFNQSLYDKHFENTKHDVISFTRAVTESLGLEGRWIHHGLTSNDVKDTALCIQLRETLNLIESELDQLMSTIRFRAEEFANTLCMGRSHGVHAEPMSFGLKLALWWDELRRHKKRLIAARKTISVGKISGPVGSYSSVPPQIEISVCRQLGLSPAPVSNQIIQRDRHAEFVNMLAGIAASLEKFATEIRSLQRTEIREVEEPFGQEGYVSKGSSSMPHKRNPELCERICGLSRIVRSNASTALENVNLWHERDISHSAAERVILPDCSLATDYMLNLFSGIISKMTVYPDRMMENIELSHGLIFSPRVMLALVEKGCDRGRAYEIVQQNSMRSWDKRADFRKLICAEPEVTSLLSETELSNLFDYQYFLKYVPHTFERIGFSASNVVPKQGD